MFKIFGKMYGRSPKWKKIREKHLKENPKCIACGREDGLEVHHISPYHIYPELELEPSNLVTLCGKYCHFIFGHYMDWKSWNENVVRDSQIYYLHKSSRPRTEQCFELNNKGRFYEIFTIFLNYITWIISKCWNYRSKD